MFHWIYGVLIFSTIVLIYIKVKAFERLSKRISKVGGLKDEFMKYKNVPYSYNSEFKIDIQSAFRIGSILKIFIDLLIVFVGFPLYLLKIIM